MKIALIYTGVAHWGLNSFYKFYNPDFNYLDTFMPPLGLCYLGAALKKNGHSVSYVDLRFLKSWEEFKKNIIELSPDIAGISFQTPNTKFAVESAKNIKQISDIPVVAGGIHSSILPMETLEFGCFDFVFVGEGEITFPKILNDIKNLTLKDKIIIGEKPEKLDALDFPYYSDLYLDNVLKQKKFALLLTSRGCPANCSFCQPVTKKVFGHKIRNRSIENIFNEIDYNIEKFNIRKFLIVDDLFTIIKSNVLEFCRKIIDEKYNISFDINCRTDYFDEEMADALADAGCNLISFGFESGSQKILDLLNKNTTVEKNYKAANIWKKKKRLLLANILTGMPGETETDRQLNLKFLLDIKPDFYLYNCLVPYPGTAIYEDCKKNNLLPSDIYFSDYEMNSVRKARLIKTVDYDRINDWETIINESIQNSKKLSYSEKLKIKIKNYLPIIYTVYKFLKQNVYYKFYWIFKNKKNVR